MIFSNYLPNEKLFFAHAENGKLPERNRIDSKYTWNLNDVYESEELWENDFKLMEQRIPDYGKFQGIIGKSAADLLNTFKFDDELGIKLERLYLYAMLSKDLDISDSRARARYDRISALYAEASARSSFIRPEILSIPRETVDKYLNELDELKIYRHAIENLFRSKEHTLSKEQEEILALSSEVSHVPYNTFSVLTDADMQFPFVKDPAGNDVQISHGRYSAALYSTDREYRQRVYKGFYQPFMTYKNTLATLFNGVIKAHIFHTKARKYNSSREAALDSNNIPVSVYDNLVSTVNENIAPLHRWVNIRKRVLGLDELHPYDAYVTLFPSVKKEYDYETAKNIVLESLNPFGTEYLSNIKKAFDERWIDVFETRGKRSGAYSSGTTFGVHPYVLLNWNNQLNDVFTLAHEMGHNMHSFYTGLNQPYAYANYSIFVAEVASTANEALLLEYLIERAESREEKLALIEKYITNITTTFYRQTGFAEFEQMVHELLEKGEALTPDNLCPMYRELTQRYWGPDMVVDPEEDYTWARVPHFYYNFYVYQYATGLAASQALTEGIKKEGKPAIDRYLSFLKSGSSDYSINILRKAGVDMDSPEPILSTIKKMNELLDQMETLLG